MKKDSEDETHHAGHFFIFFKCSRASSTGEPHLTNEPTLCQVVIPKGKEPHQAKSAIIVAQINRTIFSEGNALEKNVCGQT